MKPAKPVLALLSITLLAGCSPPHTTLAFNPATGALDLNTTRNNTLKIGKAKFSVDANGKSVCEVEGFEEMGDAQGVEKARAETAAANWAGVTSLLQALPKPVVPIVP